MNWKDLAVICGAVLLNVGLYFLGLHFLIERSDRPSQSFEETHAKCATQILAGRDNDHCKVQTDSLISLMSVFGTIGAYAVSDIYDFDTDFLNFEKRDP